MTRGVRAHERGMTLIEVLIAMSILAFIAVAMYSSFDGMRRSRAGIERITDRYREGRLAMARMAREIESAYLSEHKPIDPSFWVKKTIFQGKPGSPGARLDFNSFSNRVLRRNARESDQVELSYFAGEDPDRRGVYDLLRRQSTVLDDKPDKGGRIDVMASDIDLFDLEYLDPLSGLWRDEWDSVSVVGERGRLPRQVKITLVMNNGERAAGSARKQKIRLVSKVSIFVRDPLTFGVR